MNAQVFDLVVGIYAGMLNGAYAALIPIGLGLLVVFAVIELRMGLIWAALDGTVDLHRVAGVVVGVILQVAVVAYLLVSMNSWTTDVMNRFIDWSGKASGLINARQILWNRPSSLIDAGFLLAAPLKSMIAGAGPWDAVWFTLFYVLTIVFFMLMALASMMFQIEFRIATLAAIILLPWILFRWAAFLASGVISWLGGAAVKLFVLGIALAGVILFVGQLPPINSSGGQPPTFDDGLAVVFVAFVGCALAWFLPGQVAARFGGGGMSVSQTLAGPLAVFGVASAAVGTLRSVSSLIPRR